MTLAYKRIRCKLYSWLSVRSPSAFKRSLGVLIVKKPTPLFHQRFSVYSMGTYIDFFAILATAALLYAIHRRRKPSLPFPPGPKGLPLVGNLFQVPSELEWIKYHEWCTELSKYTRCVDSSYDIHLLPLQQRPIFFICR